MHWVNEQFEFPVVCQKKITECDFFPYGCQRLSPNLKLWVPVKLPWFRKNRKRNSINKRCNVHLVRWMDLGGQPFSPGVCNYGWRTIALHASTWGFPWPWGYPHSWWVYFMYHRSKWILKVPRHDETESSTWTLFSGREWTRNWQHRRGFHRGAVDLMGRTTGEHMGNMVGKWSSGWWFGCHFLHFPIYIGNVIIPSDELIFYIEGWPNHQPVIIHHWMRWYGMFFFPKASENAKKSWLDRTNSGWPERVIPSLPILNECNQKGPRMNRSNSQLRSTSQTEVPMGYLLLAGTHRMFIMFIEHLWQLFRPGTWSALRQQCGGLCEEGPERYRCERATLPCWDVVDGLFENGC